MSDRKVKHDNLIEFIEDTMGEKSLLHPYHLFEPWDVEMRPGWVHEIAKEYSFNLRSPELLDIIKGDSHLFQTGYLMDKGFIAAMFASNQSGKSYVALMDALIQLTGEIPVPLKHEKGYDTGIKRLISRNNILRWGRRDIETGEVIDHDPTQEESPLWHCGNVLGAGMYPIEKLAAKGSKIWIVTYKQARDETWWPQLKGVIPESMRDTSRGVDGFDNREYIVYLSNEAQIHFITYEQGETRLEGAGNLQEFEKLHMVLFDEEPPTSKYWATVTQRVPQLRIVTTPYKGLSWTYEDILVRAGKDPDINVYHCTKFDCPYYTREEIVRSMKTIKKWEVGARVFGLHTEQSGKPYYEELFEEIAQAIAVTITFDSKQIYPSFTWTKPLEIARRRDAIEMIDCDESLRDAWKIYEMPVQSEAYWMTVDTSEGSANQEDAQDAHSAQIFRLPRSDEPQWPVQVAVLDTTLPTAEVARLCLYACACYNNCLLAPEAIGKSAGTFLGVVSEDTTEGKDGMGWPFMFTMVTINDLNKKPSTKKGFYTSSKNRTQIFDYVGSLMKDCTHLTHLGIRDLTTRIQVAGCIVGNGNRPDHAKRKHNDSLVCLAIGCYVYKIARQMITNNRDKFSAKGKPDPWGGRQTFEKKRESRPLLGSKRGLDSRRK